MAELPRHSRRIRGQSPEFVNVPELLRTSRRLRGQTLEDIPSQLEGLKVLVSPSSDRSGSPEEGEPSLVEYSDSQPVVISEVTGSIASTSDIGEEPDVSEPESEVDPTPVLEFVSLTPSGPSSPRVETVITEDLPAGLIAIEELAIADIEESFPFPDNQPILEFRERESIFHSLPRSTDWHRSLTKLLENPGLSFTLPHIFYHPSPRDHYPALNMSSPSSMYSQSLEAYLYGGHIPAGYQSISGTFSGASPRPIEQKLLTGSSGTKLLSAEEILMISGQSQSG